MIHYLVCRGYGFTIRPLLKDAGAPKIVTLPYDKALRATELPKSTYIFTDIDRLSSADRVTAGRLYRKLNASGCRVFNDPGRVQTRLPLLRRLHRQGLNAFNVYALDEIDEPMRFPVFLRVADDHGGPLSDLIEDRATLVRAIDALVEIGYPPATLIVTEYAAEPIGPGIFRKLSVFRVGERFVPHPCVHDTGWTIKWGRTGVATPELYDEELEIIRTNPFAEQMREVFEIGGIDFGRVDFSFVDGRPCIYEINTNPTLAAPSPHPVPQRVESRRVWWDGLLSAMHDIDAPHHTGPQIDLRYENPAALEAALQSYPDLKQGFLRLAEALSQAGDGQAAGENAERAFAQAPHDPNVAIRVSRILADHDRLSEAADTVSRAVQANPESFDLLLHAGRVLARAGRGAAAVEANQHAIALRPDDLKGYEALYGIQWALGDPTAALDTVKTAIEVVGGQDGPAAARRLKKLRAQQRALRRARVRKRIREIINAGKHR